MTDASPLVTLTFSVARPVSVNATYQRGAGKRIFKTKPARGFAERVGKAALIARNASNWPRNQWLPAHVVVAYSLWNVGQMDCDGPRKGCRDALQGVLYANDSIVADGACPLPQSDGDESRMDVTVELWSLRTPAEAARRQHESDARRIRRIAGGAKRVAEGIESGAMRAAGARLADGAASVSAPKKRRRAAGKIAP